VDVHTAVSRQMAVAHEVVLLVGMALLLVGFERSRSLEE
jgi:hypothetical protein